MNLQPNILLISGSGRKTGKTTLACRMIGHYSKYYEITGIKISHHSHSLSYPLPVIYKKAEFIIYEETERNMQKDSSRMLTAGAARVFYITSQKESAGMAMEKILGILSPLTAIICESGGMDDFYKPGLHIHLTARDDANNKPFRANDITMRFDGQYFDPDFTGIVFENNSWKLKDQL